MTSAQWWMILLVLLISMIILSGISARLRHIYQCLRRIEDLTKRDKFRPDRTGSD